MAHEEFTVNAVPTGSLHTSIANWLTIIILKVVEYNNILGQP